MHDAKLCMMQYYARCNIMHAINVMDIINDTEGNGSLNNTKAIAAWRNHAIFFLYLNHKYEYY